MITFYQVYAFMFGSLLGSFLNVLILRLPKEEDVVFKRSHCPKCNQNLKWFHNIPIWGYLFLLGKCAYCKKKISAQYPLVEFFVAMGAYLLFPNDLSYYGMSIYIFNIICLSVFLVGTLIDMRYQIIPDGLNLFLGITCLVYGLYHLGWLSALLGGALGFGAPLAITWIYYKLRGQIGLGGGDVKLFGALGLALGPQDIALNMFLSCFTGAIFGILYILITRSSKNSPIAFGPFIYLVASFQIFFPDYYEALVRILYP